MSLPRVHMSAAERLDDVRLRAQKHKTMLANDLTNIQYNKKRPDHFTLGQYVKWMAYLTFYKLQGTETRKQHKINALNALITMIPTFKMHPSRYANYARLSGGRTISFDAAYNNTLVNPKAPGVVLSKAFYGLRSTTYRLFSEARKACQQQMKANKKRDKAAATSAKRMPFSL